MMRFIITVLLLFPLLSNAQLKLTWQDMKDVSFTKDFDPDYSVEILYPTFGTKIQKYEEKEVYIKGFLIPIDIEDGKFALSANPYQSCFFCGKAGPESVLQLKLSSKRRYLGFKMDQVLTFKGTFKLNRTDVTELVYILEDAELYYGK